MPHGTKPLHAQEMAGHARPCTLGVRAQGSVRQPDTPRAPVSPDQHLNASGSCVAGAYFFSTASWRRSNIHPLACGPPTSRKHATHSQRWCSCTACALAQDRCATLRAHTSFNRPQVPSSTASNHQRYIPNNGLLNAQRMRLPLPLVQIAFSFLFRGMGRLWVPSTNSN